MLRTVASLAAIAGLLSLGCELPDVLLRSIQHERQTTQVPVAEAPTHFPGSTQVPDPTSTSRPPATPSFDQPSDQDLLAQLACTEAGIGAVECVRPTSRDPRDVGLVDLVSTGRVVHVPLVADDGTTVLGDVTALEALTRNQSSGLVDILLLLQTEQTSHLGINSYPATYEMVYLIDLEELTEVPGSSLLRSDEAWRQLMPRGSQWEFSVSSLPYTKKGTLDGSVFQSAGYHAALRCFIESFGADCARDLIIVPVGITGISRYP